MKKLMIRIVTVLLAFVAGAGFMSYATYMGNRDMTAVMAGATLPVLYAEQDQELYNETHGYVEPMNGSYMKDSILGISTDHQLHIAVEKYNAHINSLSYEVRSLDMSRLVQDGREIPVEDDGKYMRASIDLKDLMEEGERYLFILTADTEEHGEVYYYAQISYLGENHVRECLDFARAFHDAAFQKDTNHELLKKLEPDNSVDGTNYGYVNIHSYPRTVVWGEMQAEQVSEPQIRFTDIRGSIVSLVMEYRMQDRDTKDLYQVSEAFCIQYTQSRMYLQNYERTTDRIFQAGNQIVEDGQIDFGIQSREINYRKNEEENVIGFVQQGQLWCYDFGQNRLSRVYGFEDEEDKRGLYNAHDFRILQVEDSGSMDFLVYGYMNRGLYEGRCGVLLCRYDALMNTVEERYFLPSDRPWQVVREELGRLSVVNDKDTAWLSWRGMILRIDLKSCSVRILAEGIREEELQVSKSGSLAAWTDGEAQNISLLNTRSGVVNQISAESGEQVRALGFMEEDFIYGTTCLEDIRVDAAGRSVYPMYRVIIRDHAGQEVREFDYAARGKYVKELSIVENRIDLSCIALLPDGSFEEVQPEPITYTIEPEQEKLALEVADDEVRRSEYYFAYEGTVKNGSMKRPRVRMVLYEGNRVLRLDRPGEERYLAWTFSGQAQSYETLSEAVIAAYDGMGAVWKSGTVRLWERWNRPSRMQIEGFDSQEGEGDAGSSVARCLQLLFQQKQIYTDVQACLEQGMAVWEICEQELKEDCCLIPGCSLRMALYYVAGQSPVMGITDTGDAVLIVGYDTQNIIYYEPGQTELKKAGLNDSSDMFERAGNLFFTYLPSRSDLSGT